MRKPTFLVMLAFICFAAKQTNANPVAVHDSTGKINHVLDGNTSEWKTDKFETDNDTKVLYAVDHDATNLYMALVVSDMSMQTKMMMQGMKMYIDKKAKRKEGTGIEFPIKRANGGGFRGGKEQGPPDIQSIREKATGWMIFLKTFGFDDQEDRSQLISVPDAVNIAFDWDESNTLHIEYRIPLALLGGPTALNGKPLAIGWKINGMESSSETASTSVTRTELVGVPVSTSATGGRSSGAGRASSSSSAGNSFGRDLSPGAVVTRTKDQSFWTKYITAF
jgi:hypothetical protein